MLRFIQDSYSRGVLYPHNRKLNSTKAIIFLFGWILLFIKVEIPIYYLLLTARCLVHPP